MWETALAFAIWGSDGSVLTAAPIDPTQTATSAVLKGQGAVNAVAFTLTPFSLWYRDIAAAACSLIAPSTSRWS